MRGARHLACARHCPRFGSEVSGAGRPEGPDLGRTRGRPRACVPRRGRTYVQLPRFVRSFFNVVVPVRSARSPIGNAAVCQKEREIYRPGQLAQQRRSGRMDSGQQNGWRWRRHVTPAATERCIDPIHLSRRPFCPTTPIRCFLLFSSAVVRV